MTLRASARRSLRWLLAAVLGVTVAGCATSAAAPSDAGSEAPDYAAPALDGGEELALSDLRGGVVLANTWATWCVPCREEMPFLAELQADYGADGLEVVGVNIDDGVGRDQITAFLDNVDADFANLVDPENRFARAFRTSGVPESVLIDRDGQIAYRWKGPLDVRPQETRALVEAALAGQDTAGVADVPTVGLGIAALAGLLSFLSPCVFPLIPGYFAFITGMSLDDLTDNPDKAATARASALTNGGLFVAGFSTVFIALGASATAIGSSLQDYNLWIARIGGVLVIVFGLHLIGVLRVPGLQREFRALTLFAKGGPRVRSAGAFLMGIAFAAGWTPCIGPVLAGILTLASTTESVQQGSILLTSYSAGLAVPFLAAALALGRFMKVSRRIRGWLPWIERSSGALLVIVGLLLVTGSFRLLANWLPAFDPLG